MRFVISTAYERTEKRQTFPEGYAKRLYIFIFGIVKKEKPYLFFFISLFIFFFTLKHTARFCSDILTKPITKHKRLNKYWPILKPIVYSKCLTFHNRQNSASFI